MLERIRPDDVAEYLDNPAPTATLERINPEDVAEFLDAPPMPLAPPATWADNPIERGLRSVATNPNAPALVSDVAAGVYGGAMNLGSLAARPLGIGDEMVRNTNQFDTAAAQAHPGLLNTAARGTVNALTSMVPATMAAGPFGGIGMAVAQEANSAVTEGGDMGKSGADLAKYVIREGAIEGLPAAVAQTVGLGGVEQALGNLFKFGGQGMVPGVVGALRKMGVITAQELPEELVTEIGHNINKAMSGIDPNATTPEALWNTGVLTTLQTVMTGGLLTGAGAIAGDSPPPPPDSTQFAEPAPGVTVQPAPGVTVDGSTFTMGPTATPGAPGTQSDFQSVLGYPEFQSAVKARIDAGETPQAATEAVTREALQQPTAPEIASPEPVQDVSAQIPRAQFVADMQKAGNTPEDAEAFARSVYEDADTVSLGYIDYVFGARDAVKGAQAQEPDTSQPVVTPAISRPARGNLPPRRTPSSRRKSRLSLDPLRTRTLRNSRGK